MLKNMELTESDLLAYDLLRMPNGPRFELAAANLRAFLRKKGTDGHTTVYTSLRRMLYRTFRHDAESLQDKKLSHTLLIADRFETMWEDALSCANRDGPDTVEDHLRITQLMEFLEVAKTDKEINEYLDDLWKALLSSNKALLLTTKWQVELHLTKSFVEALEQMSGLSAETSRDITLYHFMEETYPIDQKLHLISAFHGELLLLTPENVHKLNGKHDGKFLKQEMDRLARRLPLIEFLQVLGAMNNAEHPSNSVADGVLNGLCMEYQAMLGPVG